MPFLHYDLYCCRRSGALINHDIANINKFINTHQDLTASQHELFPLNQNVFIDSLDTLIALPPERISEYVLKFQEQLINTVNNSRTINYADKIKFISIAVQNPNKSLYAILDVISKIFAVAGFLALPEVYRKLPEHMFSDDPQPHFYLYCMQFLLVLSVPIFITIKSSKLQEKHTKQNRNISNDQEKFELWLFDVKKQIDMLNRKRVRLSPINEETEGIELNSYNLTP